MRWLLHGRTKSRPVKGGEVLHQRCPECREDTTFHEVEITTSAGAWFIDVASSTERAFACAACGETFDLRDAADAPAASAAAQALPAPRPPRDLAAELERERARRAEADAARDRKVDDELADLKRRLGK